MVQHAKFVILTLLILRCTQNKVHLVTFTSMPRLYKQKLATSLMGKFLLLQDAKTFLKLLFCRRVAQLLKDSYHKCFRISMLLGIAVVSKAD